MSTASMKADEKVMTVTHKYTLTGESVACVEFDSNLEAYVILPSS